MIELRFIKKKKNFKSYVGTDEDGAIIPIVYTAKREFVIHGSMDFSQRKKQNYWFKNVAKHFVAQIKI